ncbi:hypothetical protein EXS70_02530 [Candidatus Peribacteria bacterium]|nr:hypothetical protein [Candidatus Peribacteria bacterium]
MKKFSLLLGTLGGAMAGYILSNEKLRKQMSEAPNAEAMAKMLGEQLTKDGKKVAKEVKSFVESDDVQKNLKKAKAFASKKLGVAQHELEKYAKKGMKEAKKYAKQGAKKMKAMV